MKRLFIALFALLLLAGCNRSSPPAASETHQPLRIGYSLSDFRQDFFQAMKEGVENEAKAENATVQITDANGQARKQISDVQDLLNKGIDVLLITPQDSAAIVPAVKRANAAKVPVIIVDIGSQGGDLASTIISDNVQGGRLAGEFMVKMLPKGSRVVHLQAQLGAENARKRGQGFTEGAARGGLVIVPPQPADSLRDKAVSVMGGILQANPEPIKGVFAENDDMAIGALLAATHAGREKGLVVVGFNGDPDALKLIGEGKMAATVMQFPYDMGVTAVKTAVKVHAKQPVEKETPVPVELVTKENLSHYGPYRRK